MLVNFKSEFHYHLMRLSPRMLMIVWSATPKNDIETAAGCNPVVQVYVFPSSTCVTLAVISLPKVVTAVSTVF